MQEIASWALNSASLKGAFYADARIVNERGRSLATKNGKIGSAADSESLGIGVRGETAETFHGKRIPRPGRLTSGGTKSRLVVGRIVQEKITFRRVILPRCGVGAFTWPGKRDSA